MRPHSFGKIVAGFALLLCVMPNVVMAREGWHLIGSVDGGLAAAFMQGFVHPLTGLDHLLVMLSVGVWSAQTARRVWLAPLAFALMLLVGASAGMAGVSMSAAEWLVAVSVVALGLLVAGRVQLPASMGVGFVGGFAFFHGITHGIEFGTLHGAAQYAILAGMLLCTMFLHMAGILVGRLLQQSRRISRGVGIAVALLGGSLLLQAI